MKYTCFLRAHANGRYQAAVLPLAAAELSLTLQRCDREVLVKVQRRFGLDVLDFECEELSQAHIREIAHLAHLYLLVQESKEGLFLPLTGSAEPYLGSDLSGILKYKGKTNEIFTRFLLQVAYCSSDFFGTGDVLHCVDAMCGRGTTLFEAVNRGWNAAGVDIQHVDVEEAGKFFKKYLEYHHIKHDCQQVSMTFHGKEAAQLKTYEFAKDASAFKMGDTRRLTLAAMDGARLHELWPKPTFHLMVVDLPYGVQHAPGGTRIPSLLDMLKSVLPSWKAVLRKGGALAVAFNTNTLKRDWVCAQLSDVGMKVMTGSLYDGLSHWVEQSITRDIAVAVRV